MPYTKGNGNVRHNRNNKQFNCFGKYNSCETTGFDDEGSASRYFKNCKYTDKDVDFTAKPVELLQYLIRLITPKSSIILDPFMRTNHIEEAIRFENEERNADYKFVGIK